MHGHPARAVHTVIVWRHCFIACLFSSFAKLFEKLTTQFKMFNFHADQEYSCFYSEFLVDWLLKAVFHASPAWKRGFQIKAFKTRKNSGQMEQNNDGRCL